VRRGRIAAAAALVLGAAGAAAFPLWGPPVLREVPWFAAVRIEVAGTRLLAPDEAVALSGVRIGDNVWTEPDAWVAALKAHPVVDDAAVERRLPDRRRLDIGSTKTAVVIAEVSGRHPAPPPSRCSGWGRRAPAGSAARSSPTSRRPPSRSARRSRRPS
jgi:hypothetical protein